MADITGPTCFKNRKAMLAYLHDGGYERHECGAWYRKSDDHEVLPGFTQFCGYHISVERYKGAHVA